MDAFEKEELKSKLEWELEEFVIDRLNGERVELKAVDNERKFYVSWTRRRKEILTGITIAPELLEKLKNKIDAGEYDQYVEDVYLIQDAIDVRIHNHSGKNSSWKIDMDVLVNNDASGF